MTAKQTLVLGCNCKDWKKSEPQIRGAQTLATLLTAGLHYTGATFRYCPWCGKTLKLMVPKG